MTEIRDEGKKLEALPDFDKIWGNHSKTDL